jgi:hypothetical protein
MCGTSWAIPALYAIFAAPLNHIAAGTITCDMGDTAYHAR